VYDDLESASELPIGWTDHQDAGTYRLERRTDDARFGFAVGPHSRKRFLLPPRREAAPAHEHRPRPASLEAAHHRLHELVEFAGSRQPSSVQPSMLIQPTAMAPLRSDVDADEHRQESRVSRHQSPRSAYTAAHCVGFGVRA
jgi:hypothetical protein